MITAEFAFLKFHDSHLISIMTPKYFSVKFYFSIKLLPLVTLILSKSVSKVASEFLN